jgi:thiol:disulfide interchange protein
MKTAFRSILTFIVLTAQILFAQHIDSAKPTTQHHQKFDPARNAQKDIQDAIVLAKKFNKRILLDIGGEWCIWCHRLDSLFVQNKDLENFLNKHYVVVKINVSKENENKEALSKYPVIGGYPHIFILEKNGQLIHSQDTGELEFPKDHPNKGHDKTKVLMFLKKWVK